MILLAHTHISFSARRCVAFWPQGRQLWSGAKNQDPNPSWLNVCHLKKKHFPIQDTQFPQTQFGNSLKKYGVYHSSHLEKSIEKTSCSSMTLSLLSSSGCFYSFPPSPGSVLGLGCFVCSRKNRTIPSRPPSFQQGSSVELRFFNSTICVKLLYVKLCATMHEVGSLLCDYVQL